MANSHTEIALRLQSVIDMAIDAIITINSHGVIETINHAGTKLFGYEKYELLGQKINTLMPRDYAEKHDGYLEQYEKTRERKIIGIGREVRGLKKDGTIFPIRLAVSEVVLNDRVIYTGIIHDLSEIKNAQKETEELNRELESKVNRRTYELEKVVNQLLSTNDLLKKEIDDRIAVESKLKDREKELQELLDREKELNELKSRFVSMASHEFRTPLASIMSSAALISRYTEGEQQEKREKHIDRIKNAVANLTGILNDFLSLSKLEEGKVTLTTSTVDLQALMKVIMDEISGLLKENQNIVVHFNGDQKAAEVDDRILKNILFNLLTNAIKYSDKDISCSFNFDENHYTISVKDQGIGIPEADQKYLFSRFFRAGNVTNIQGTGLGLNIVKRYVDLLEGDITFNSVFNEGTEFKVKLPYKSEIHE